MIEGGFSVGVGVSLIYWTFRMCTTDFETYSMKAT